MGRPRKPTALLELNGTIAQRPARYAKQQRELEPQVDEPVGNPPKYLTADEIKIWRELKKTVSWLTIVDRTNLECVCMLTAKLRNRTIKTQEMSQLMAFLSKLGMTPADRSRIHMPTKPQAKTDDAFSFLDAPTDSTEDQVQ
jgi:phage terminase small subunit